MEVEVRSWENSDGLVVEELFIDGKERLHVGPLCECPEDAIIGRDLVSCSDVVDFMEKAYVAGKNGEAFNFKFIEGD